MQKNSEIPCLTLKMKVKDVEDLAEVRWLNVPCQHVNVYRKKTRISDVLEQQQKQRHFRSLYLQIDVNLTWPFECCIEKYFGLPLTLVRVFFNFGITFGQDQSYYIL